MDFLKKGQEIRAWVDLPPPRLIRAMPERKRFFSLRYGSFGLVRLIGRFGLLGLIW